MADERRFTREIRVILGDHQPRLVGHAAVFNSLSEDLGGFREKIAPGAFAATIKTADVRALWNHDPNFVLARTKSGTLRLREDERGLWFEADLLDEPFERSLIKKIERGDITQNSFGFRVMPDGQNWAMEDGALIRTLTNVDLFDVSPVAYPAYTQTDLGVRNLAVEMRSKLEGGANDDTLEEKKKAEFLARAKERREFIERRTPPPDPLSYSEILRSAGFKRT